MTDTNEIAVRSADQKHCFSCANIIHTSSVFCPKCGAAQQPVAPVVPQVANTGGTENMTNKSFCRGCGQVIHASAVTCPKCGAPQRSGPSLSDLSLAGDKNRVAAALLAFFLGGFGVHKFYLGQIGWGFVYLIFCWTFIPAIVAFIEAIVYLSMSDDAFSRKYR